MASVKDTVKFAMLSYPTITQTVGAALHQMFYVNGNGMEWVNGELVDRFENRFPFDVEAIAAKERAEFVEQIKKYQDDPMFSGSDASFDLERELYDYEFTVANIDRVVSETALRRAEYEGRNLYPLCEYAKIMNVPEDVQTDWLWAAHYFVSNTQVALRQRRGLNEDEQYYADTLPVLNKRFKNMLVARGEMATEEEQNALMNKILAELKAEGTI